MINKRDYTDYLKDILDSIEKVNQFIQDMNYMEFKQDDKTIYAVIRAIEILGEASKQIPKEMKRIFPDVPWREMAGMRDKLIHNYFGINIEVVWKTAIQDIPPLKPLIESIIKFK